MKNIGSNLKEDGLLLFDIFNLEYLLEGDNITNLTMDEQRKVRTKTYREIQYSTITKDGILASYDIYHEQEEGQEPIITNAYQTLQVYNPFMIFEMLERNGFELVQQTDIDGSTLEPLKTERILTVARKVG